MVRQEPVKLTAAQRRYLTKYVSSGTRSARSIRRARTLLLLAQGELSQSAIARQLGCTANTVTSLIRRYHECGRDVAATLLEKPRPGQPRVLSAQAEAHLTALACCAAPDGRSAWTLHLLADQMVQLGFVDSLSHETVRRTLKKTSSNPG